MSTGGCVTNNQRYLQYQITLTSSAANTPTFSDITMNMSPSDTTAPTTNASAIAMTKSSGGTSVSSNGWTNGASPYFSWTAGADNTGGSGLKGYCLYLGADSAGNPSTAKGLLGTSPVSTTGSTCQFIVSGTSVNLATSGYIGTALSTSSSAYYLNVKAIDNGNNIFATSSAFQFRFDNTAPTNVSYTSCASGNFSNVADMSFSWPITGSVASSDSHAGLLDWQYQINSTAGTWNTITGASYTLVSGTDTVASGNNIIYFRTEDAAGNTSSDATIRTCNLSYGGAAPSFGGSDTVTITPSTSTSNSYALSWPAATATSGQTVAHYYFMINTSPPSTLATLQGNASTYIDNSTTQTVSAAALASVNKGTNTVYVVAIDNATTPNYSPSNYISGTFTLSSTDPDNVGSVVASDSSIKASSQWNVTLTWVAPTYQGAGNLTYLVKRSTDNSTFTQVGTTTGLSYVDTTPSSAKYYYKVYTKDGADAQSSGTNAVSITPTGKWTSAPSLDSGPTAGSLTTKKATITWSTSRSADSKIQYGTTSGSYGSVEPSNSSQVTSHSIQLTGLNPGTTYYYKAKWTDEDGNTGTSDEKSFATASAPTVKDPKAKSVGLTTAIIQYTVNNASSVKIYYGTTSSFGGATTISTSTSDTTYTTELTGLLDGTKYYYKINTFDSESTEYEGSILTFETLPRPKITNVRIQQVT
ncbi:MAG: fibronectin type III domain-containing protein, partial [Patescibacteria group bacterium]|nr:fibronectin type III domain-containing protein [Patescibacteria group bacterium]